MTRLPVSRPIAEWHDVDQRKFREEIVAQYRPAVLRGLVRSWPAVRAASTSHADFVRYLVAFDNGKPVDAILMPPHARGRIAYNESMDGVNFAHRRLPVAAIVEQLSRYALFDNPPSVALQSAPIPECLPGFAGENRLAILDERVEPRIWLGNRVTVPAHVDESNNVACVVVGRRRFTLFPPEQVANLYIGPLDYAPTGAAMSVVNLVEPDLERFPRLEYALSESWVAELEPGDALFIPTLWWHHVESLDPKLNVLVNYWWAGALGNVESTVSALDCMLHALLNIRSLSPDLRRAWAALFRHYVFESSEESFRHIPESRRGVLGTMSPEARQRLRNTLAAKLQRDQTRES